MVRRDKFGWRRAGRPFWGLLLLGPQQVPPGYVTALPVVPLNAPPKNTLGDRFDAPFIFSAHKSQDSELPSKYRHCLRGKALHSVYYY